MSFPRPYGRPTFVLVKLLTLLRARMKQSNHQIIAEILRTHFWQMEWGAMEYYREIFGGLGKKDAYINPELDDLLKHPSMLVFRKGETEPKSELFITRSTTWYEKYGELTDDDQIINVLPISGPITSGGTWCAYGTRELADQFTYADNSEHVVGHLLIFDTPGGSADANDLNELLQNSNKPVVGLIRGQNASKGVDISSFVPYMFAERSDNEIGSIGCYSSFSGRKHGFEQDGRVYVEVYDPNSPKKNYEFREAIQKGNYKPLEERLTKIGENFRSHVKSRWPEISEEMMSGDMYSAKEVIGKMVDGIKSYEETIDFIFEKAGIERKQKGKVTPLGIIPEKEEESQSPAYPFASNNSSDPIPEETESKESNLSPSATEVTEEEQPHNTNPQTPLFTMDITKLRSILGPDVQATVDENGQVVMTQELNDAVFAALENAQSRASTLEQEKTQLQQAVTQKDQQINELSQETRPFPAGAAPNDNALEKDTVVEGSILDGMSHSRSQIAISQRMAKVEAFAKEMNLM